MTINITDQSGGVWQVDAPHDLDPNDVTPSYDPSTNTLTVTFDLKAQDLQLPNEAHYQHGVEFLTFTAPTPPPSPVLFGYKTNLVVKVINDTGVTLQGFNLQALNEFYSPTTKYDTTDPHPSNYAHFHGETYSTFPGGGTVFYAPDGSVAPGGPASTSDDPAANQIVDEAPIVNGATLTSAPFTLHSAEVANQDNNFSLMLTPLSTQQTVPPAIIGASASIHNGGAPYGSVTIADTTGHPDVATIVLADANKITSDYVGKFAPVQGLTEVNPGIYTLAANDPAGLTAELRQLVFTEGPDANNGTINLTISNGASASTQAIANLIMDTSFDGKNVVNSSDFIKDANGNIWSVNNGRVNVNDFDDDTTARVIALAYKGGRVYQENADKQWWSKTMPSDQWASGAPPATQIVQIPASPNDTIATGANATQAIVDGQQNAWSIVNGQVDVNGTIDQTTGNVIKLAYVDGKIWQENDNDLWWSKTSPGDTWSPAPGTSTSPLPITVDPLPNNVTVSQSAISVNGTAGDHMVFINGSNDTVSLSGGNNTITDTGNNNTYVLPRGGNGSDTFTSNVIGQGDTLDLRTALHSTTWDGSAGTLSKYLSVASSGSNTVLSISATAGGSSQAIATINAMNTDLNGLLPHMLT